MGINLDQFFTNSTIGIYRSTPEGRVLVANPALVTMLGYDSEEELLAINLESKGFSNDSPRALFKQMMEREGFIKGYETLWIKKNGEQIYLRESAVANRDEKGTIRFYDGIVEDITEQKITVQKLRTREKFLSDLNEINALALNANNTTELFSILSEKLTKALQADHCYITFWNDEKNQTVPFFATHMGHDDYQNQKREENEVTLTESVMKAGRPIIVEDVFNTPHLSKSIALQFPNKSLLGIPLIANNKKLGAILAGFVAHHTFSQEEVNYGNQAAKQIALIITKIQSMAELREAAAKLEQLNAEKDKLFSVISHDIRSPLSAVLGLSEVLSDDLEFLDSQRIRLYANSINKSAHNLYRLVENLLAWSNMQRGAIKPDFVRHNLNLIIEEVLELVKPSAEQKELSIQTELNGHIKLVTDYNLLMTILRNLLTNAIKFTPKSGSINLKVLKTNTEIVIECQDTGVGMSQEQLSELFSFKSSKSTPGTEKEQGTGLGLVLCHEFSQILGGSMRVESEINVGSRFILHLPLIQVHS